MSDSLNIEPKRTEYSLLDPDFAATLGPLDQIVSEVIQPKGLRPHRTLFGAIQALHGLPFILSDELERALRYPAEYEESHYVKDARFPVERIVSAKAFESWAGRGFYKGEIMKKDGTPSAIVIHAYSRKGQTWDEDDPVLSIFKDKVGEIWGYTSIDGAHRTAAAKLKGDKVLRATVETSSFERLPVLNVDLSEVILRYGRATRDFLGKVALARESARLTYVSMLANKPRP